MHSPTNSTEESLQKCVHAAVYNATDGRVIRIAGFLRVECANNHSYELSLNSSLMADDLAVESRSPLHNSSPASFVSGDQATLDLTPDASEISTPKVSRRKAYQPKKVPSEFALTDTTKSSDILTEPSSLTASPTDDNIKPLNPDTFQASVNQVLTPSMPAMYTGGQFHCFQDSTSNLSPIPSMVTGHSLYPFGNGISGTPLGKTIHKNDFLHFSGKGSNKSEQKRKIKPKPVSVNGTGVRSSPYVRNNGLSKRNANKEFPCNQCGEKFKSLNTLTDHTTQVHGCFRCTTCDSQFTQRSNLQRHSLKHLGYKPFVCGNCKKEYYRKDHLVRHIEVSHPGSDPKTTVINSIPSAECVRLDELAKAKAKVERSIVESNSPITAASIQANGSPQSAIDFGFNIKEEQPLEIPVNFEAREWGFDEKPDCNNQATDLPFIAEMPTSVSGMNDVTMEEPQDLSMSAPPPPPPPPPPQQLPIVIPQN